MGIGEKTKEKLRYKTLLCNFEESLFFKHGYPIIFDPTKLISQIELPKPTQTHAK